MHCHHFQLQGSLYPVRQSDAVDTELCEPSQHRQEQAMVRSEQYMSISDELHKSLQLCDGLEGIESFSRRTET